LHFSIVTPSYNQLEWLRLCVASVRGQVTAGDGGMQNNPELKIQPLAVEHLIQDAGSPGIEEFAHEIGADFYRNGQLISSAPAPQISSIAHYRITVFLSSVHSSQIL